MLEKLAHDIETAAMRKLAAVPGDVKQYRRAIQMLRSGSHDFHGTSGPGFRKVLESGYIRPGDNSMLSPVVSVKGSTASRVIPEVYMGSGKPPYPYMAGGFPGIAVDKRDMSRLAAPIPTDSDIPEYLEYLFKKPRTVPEAAYLNGPVPKGYAVDWTIFPGEVPIVPKSYAIANSAALSANDDNIRRFKLRRIKRDIFDKAITNADIR